MNREQEEQFYEAMQKAMNAHAGRIAQRYGIRQSQFQVFLCDEIKKGDMVIQAGPVVQIYMKFTDFYNANAKLHNAFSVIRKYKTQMITPMEIVPYALVTSETRKYDKWKKEKFGDVDKIIANVLPVGRIKFKRTLTVEAKDKDTGLSVTIQSLHGKTNIQQLEHEARLALSRAVFNSQKLASSTELVPMSLIRSVRKEMYQYGSEI